MNKKNNIFATLSRTLAILAFSTIIPVYAVGESTSSSTGQRELQSTGDIEQKKREVTSLINKYVYYRKRYEKYEMLERDVSLASKNPDLYEIILQDICIYYHTKLRLCPSLKELGKRETSQLIDARCEKRAHEIINPLFDKHEYSESVENFDACMSLLKTHNSYLANRLVGELEGTLPDEPEWVYSAEDEDYATDRPSKSFAKLKFMSEDFMSSAHKVLKLCKNRLYDMGEVFSSVSELHSTPDEPTTLVQQEEIGIAPIRKSDSDELNDSSEQMTMTRAG